MSIDGMSDGMEGAEIAETQDATQPESSIEETMSRAYDAAQVDGATKPEAVEEDDYPQSYKADYRPHWKSASPEFRQYLAQRERESQGKISELGTPAKEREAFREITERYRHRLPEGVAEHQAYEHLLAAHDFLEENPEGALRYLAQQYGVNLGATPAESGEAHRVTQQKQVTAAIEQFKSGKEYWSDLEEDMIDQIHAIRARDPDMAAEKVLQQAYDRAMRVNDKVWQSVEGKRQAEASAKSFEEAKKKADAAKRAISLNVRSSHAAPVKRGTWEDTLRAVGERVTSR